MALWGCKCCKRRKPPRAAFTLCCWPPGARISIGTLGEGRSVRSPSVHSARRRRARARADPSSVEA
eukprot:9654041-Alexandrium_andersonii.AAC.1